LFNLSGISKENPTQSFSLPFASLRFRPVCLFSMPTYKNKQQQLFNTAAAYNGANTLTAKEKLTKEVSKESLRNERHKSSEHTLGKDLQDPNLSP
jgi:hypothetical protein